MYYEYLWCPIQLYKCFLRNARSMSGIRAHFCEDCYLKSLNHPSLLIKKSLISVSRATKQKYFLHLNFKSFRTEKDFFRPNWHWTKGRNVFLKYLEGNQNKNNYLVSNSYNKWKSRAFFSYLYCTEKSVGNFNLL